jgi:hypothetical protein
MNARQVTACLAAAAVLAVLAWKLIAPPATSLTQGPGRVDSSESARGTLERKMTDPSLERDPVDQTIAVTVRDPSGKGLDGAALHALPNEARGIPRSSIAIATTGIEGLAALRPDEVRSKFLAASKPGYRSTGVAVSATPSAQYVVTMHPDATVAMRFKDLHGTPIGNLQVVLHQAALSHSPGQIQADMEPLDVDKRGLAHGVTDQDGACILRGLKPESYWVHWDDSDWAEVAGPDGRITLRPGTNQVEVTLAMVVALVGPKDVLTMAADLPAGLSHSQPSSIQGSIQLSRWRLRQRFPGTRNIVAVEVIPGAAGSPVKASGWTSEGLRFEESITMRRPSEVEPFSVRNRQGTGPGAGAVLVELFSSDDTRLDGVELDLESSYRDKPIMLSCVSGESMKLPSLNFTVTLRGWGTVGEISEAAHRAGLATIRLPSPARVVKARIQLPDGSPVMFAIEKSGNRLSTFYGGTRVSVLPPGPQTLEFQVPGWKPIEVPLQVEGAKRSLQEVSASLTWGAQ